MLGDVDADLHLDDTCDFSGVVDNLKSLSLFRHIELSNQSAEFKRFELSIKGIKGKLSSPIPDIWGFQNESRYTDIYFDDRMTNKMYYYYRIDQGDRPRVHFLDEGMTNYYKDVIQSANNDFIDHKKYKGKRYIDNIVEQLLFNPELNCWHAGWTVTKIPEVNQDAKQAILFVYNNPKIQTPQERYIYLSMYGYDSQYFTNEIDLLNSIANIVGKENIIVKLHPRFSLDQFSKFGYKIWNGDTSIPWEVFLIEHDTSDQILLTVFSNATLSQYNLFGRDQTVIFLYKLFAGTPIFGLVGRNMQESYRYLNKIIQNLNMNKKLVYCPDSINSLNEIMRYLEGKRKSGI